MCAGVSHQQSVKRTNWESAPLSQTGSQKKHTKTMVECSLQDGEEALPQAEEFKNQRVLFRKDGRME